MRETQRKRERERFEVKRKNEIFGEFIFFTILWLSILSNIVAQISINTSCRLSQKTLLMSKLTLS